MKPFDVFLAVLVAVIWGLGFVASRLALDERSPALMTAMRFAIAAAPCPFVRRPKVPWTVLVGETFGPLRLTGMLTVVGGIAIMLLSKRPQAVRKQVLPKTA